MNIKGSVLCSREREFLLTGTSWLLVITYYY